MPHDATLPCSVCGDERRVCYGQIQRVRRGGQPLICAPCRRLTPKLGPIADPVKPCKHCGTAFVRWPVRYCEACRPFADAKRRKRSGVHTVPAAERGYGPAHVAERKRRRGEFAPGDPCARCGDPMWDVEQTDLDHTDDRTGYLGLSHSACNRANRKHGVVHEHRDTVCDTCGVPYRTIWPEQRYCSNPCRLVALAERNRVRNEARVR
jgi:predicted nucleic acid-binding Zn ribbon protein